MSFTMFGEHSSEIHSTLQKWFYPITIVFVIAFFQADRLFYKDEKLALSKWTNKANQELKTIRTLKISHSLKSHFSIKIYKLSLPKSMFINFEP